MGKYQGRLAGDVIALGVRCWSASHRLDRLRGSLLRLAATGFVVNDRAFDGR